MLAAAVFSSRFLRLVAKIQRPEEAARFLRLDRYWQPELAQALLARVDQLVSLKPRQALGLAEIALALVQRIRDPGRELEAHAYTSLATTQRWIASLEEAGANFEMAEQLAQGGRPTVLAMVLRQKSLLLVDLGQPDAALALARRAVELDRASGLFPVKSLTFEGIVLGYRGEHAASAVRFREVLEQADPDSDDYLFATNNLIATLLQRPLLASDIVEARKTLRTIQRRIRGMRETPLRYIVWHVEGRLHAQLAEYRQAASHYAQSREGYLRLAMIPDYARVSADLVEVLVRKGDGDGAREVIAASAETIEGFAAGFAGHQRFAEAFRQSAGQPLEQAAELIRGRLLGAAASNEAQPPE